MMVCSAMMLLRALKRSTHISNDQIQGGWRSSSGKKALGLWIKKRDLMFMLMLQH
jgi:hypothetical protein